MGLTRIGRNLLAINIGVGSVALAEYLGYYKLLPVLIRKNFSSYPHPEDPSLAEPVLLRDKESTIVFKHRGGSQAAKSLLFDAFENNNLVRRAIALQLACSFTFSFAIFRGAAYLTLSACCLVVSNLFVLWRPLVNSYDMYKLSQAVSNGQAFFFENLNEARYVQILTSMEAPLSRYSQLLGYSLAACTMAYCSPVYGTSFAVLGYLAGCHKRLN